MKKLLFFLLIPILSFGQVQIGDDIDGEAANDFSGGSVSLSSDGTILAIGASGNDDSGSNSGHVRVYENQENTWVQIGQDINGETAFDFSGDSISLSSDGATVAIGAFLNSGNGIRSGHVRIYENQGGNWVQIGEDIDGEAENDESGASVSLSSDGSIVAIGAHRNDANGSNSGHVRVYENQGGNWVQIGEDIDGEAGGDLSGTVSLSSDGAIVAIGAEENDDNGAGSGHVRIYENQGGNWNQIGQDIEGEAVFDGLGISVSLSSNGNVVAMGATGNGANGSNSGHVRIYENQGGNWVQIGEDIDGEAEFDNSGRSVSLSSDGSLVAIGAAGNNDNGTDSGHVRVFDLSGLLSTQESSLTTFSIYPNPAKETITLTLSEVNTLQKVTIYNSLGQEVVRSTQSSIDVSSLSKGVYVIEVQTTTGKASEKLIIQ